MERAGVGGQAGRQYEFCVPRNLIPLTRLEGPEPDETHPLSFAGHQLSLQSSTQKELFHSGIHLFLCSPTLFPSVPTCWHVVRLALRVESQGSRCLQGALPHGMGVPVGKDASEASEASETRAPGLGRKPCPHTCLPGNRAGLVSEACRPAVPPALQAVLTCGFSEPTTSLQILLCMCQGQNLSAPLAPRIMEQGNRHPAPPDHHEVRHGYSL